MILHVNGKMVEFDEKESEEESVLRLTLQIADMIKDRMEEDAELKKITQRKNVMLLLSELYFEDGKTQLSLAKLTDMKPSTVSVELKSMENEGLVQRVQDENDKRAFRVYLTELGSYYGKRIYGFFREKERVCTQDLTKQELRTGRMMLEKIRDELRREIDN